MAGKNKQVGVGEKLVGKVQRHGKIIAGALFAVFAALYLYPDLPTQDILRALDIVSQHGIQKQPQNIAVGWNANLDLNIDAIEFMKELGVEASLSMKDHSMISTLDQLNAAFTFHFNENSAAERHVKDEALFAKLLKAAEKLKNKQYTIGGNAALMASQFVKEGHNVVLGGPIGPKVTSLLHSSIILAQPTPSEGQNRDEVHIILEYGKGAKWGDFFATRGNRFILSRDASNSNLLGMEELNTHLVAKEFVPNIFVASGISLLEGNKPEVRTKRLNDVVRLFREMNSTIPIHLEFASIGDIAFLQEAAMTLFPEIDSIGFNEQELAGIYSSLGGEYNETIRKEDITSQVPIPSTIAVVMRYIFQKFHTSENHQLTRMHFHSFSYHIIAELVTSRASLWKNSKAAVARGAVAATTNACDMKIEDIREKDIEFLAPLSFEVQTNVGLKPIDLSSVNPVGEWKISLHNGETKSPLEIEFSLAGIPVCSNPQHTVGLGDVISAAGLSHSL